MSATWVASNVIDYRSFIYCQFYDWLRNYYNEHRMSSMSCDQLSNLQVTAPFWISSNECNVRYRCSEMMKFPHHSLNSSIVYAINECLQVAWKWQFDFLQDVIKLNSNEMPLALLSTVLLHRDSIRWVVSKVVQLYGWYNTTTNAEWVLFQCYPLSNMLITATFLTLLSLLLIACNECNMRYRCSKTV